MKREIKVDCEPKSPPSLTESLPSRQAALDRYCQLFARGLFPVLVEESDGRCRIFLSAEERQ